VVAPNRSRPRGSALVLFFLLALVSSRAAASPWLPAPGRVYLQLSESFVSTAEGFDHAGHRRPLLTMGDNGLPVPTRLSDGETHLYAEIGLATRLAITAEMTVLSVIAQPRGGHLARKAVGAGDLTAGIRLQLLDEEVTCAIDARLGIPTGSADAQLPLGTGDLRGEMILSFGRVWDHVPIFLVAELGARIRSSGTQRAQAAGRPADVDPLSANPTDARVTLDYASEIVYGLALGYIAKVRERIRLQPRISVDGRHGLSAPQPLPIDPIAPASMRLVRLGAALGVSIDLPQRHRRASGRVDVSVTGGAFVWGEGLPAAGDFGLALAFAR
jgi:hypothetical protein